MDIAIALLPSLLYGCTSLIIMSLGGDPRQQSTGQLLGGFIVALVALPFVGTLHTWQGTVVAIGAGFAMGLGLALQVRTFHIIGVGRTMPIATGGQILGISLVGILVMGEWRGSEALPIGFAGLAVIILGVAATSWSQKTSQVQVDWKTATPLLVISVIALCTYVLLLRLFDLDPLAAFFPVGIGFLLAGFIFNSPRFTPQLGPKETRWSKYTVRQMISGLVWGTGTIIMQYSTANVGVAVGFTMSQLGVAISTFGAVLVLGERRTRKEWWVTSGGVVLLLLGTVLVGYAKQLDT